MPCSPQLLGLALFLGLGSACSPSDGEPITSSAAGGKSSLGGANAGGPAGGAVTGGSNVGGRGDAAPLGGSGSARAGGGAGGGGGGGAGMSADGAGADSGGAADDTPCSAGPWTCVPVDGAAPYASHTFDVPAQQNWVNTGLYLKKGQAATLSETGSWQLSNSGSSIDHGPCKVGDLVARIGLFYKDQALTCIEGTRTFTAPKDGILFVGALAGNDLGETYETRSDASGLKSVTVSSEHSTVPTVPARDASSFDFEAVESGWVEIWGDHVILTLPVTSAMQDAAVLGRATARLDAIYELEAELRSAVPHHGQRIRFFPDGSQPGYMLAGNPVRMATTLVDGGDQTRISRAGEASTDIWGFAHEMGHDFSFAPHGFWTYEENTLESWCNVFAIYALESLQLPLNASTSSCTESSTGDYATWDAWGGLCFLRQFQFRYGWDFYRQYFDRIKDTTSTGGDAWAFVHDQFAAAAGQDVDPLFDAWKVPHP